MGTDCLFPSTSRSYPSKCQDIGFYHGDCVRVIICLCCRLYKNKGHFAFGSGLRLARLSFHHSISFHLALVTFTSMPLTERNCSIGLSLLWNFPAWEIILPILTNLSKMFWLQKLSGVGRKLLFLAADSNAPWPSCLLLHYVWHLYFIR